ncbi:MAG: glucuronate isomerase [Planctomycetes bacterium]|nr:glucuronate isomerase [Planctomycetota bacterium]
MAGFLKKEFLLQTEDARILYYKHADRMPVFDYHCHLSPKQIADDINFQNLTQVWLNGDHYKWRAMRAFGIDEKYITGDADDWEKFENWAQTVPYILRNPLYHWTHLELKRYFGIEKLLNPQTAGQIYEACSEMLKTPQFSTRNIMRNMNVKVVCTTDDPTDSLEHHIKIKEDGFEVKVLPTWRPDKAMAVENIEQLNSWVDKLADVTDIDIKDYQGYIEALQKRHDFFAKNGCRISDRDLKTAYAEDYTEKEIGSIFGKIRSGKELESSESLKFKSAMMFEFAIMDHEKGWVQQLHIGALRNNNTRMLKALGSDAGCDSIGDFEIARPLARFLDRLDRNNKLPKTIIYNLNPKDTEVIATMIGNFQNGNSRGKLQLGPAWWFLDQKDGIERQIQTLSNMGLLSTFIGMLTDSRSFLSYTRHEYFRRILCNILGNDIRNGEIPRDMELIGRIVEDICYNNAHNYFMV